MSSTSPSLQETDIGPLLYQLAAADAVQSNCMFQLSMMLARIALEPGAETYKEEAAQAILGLIRSKPRSNVLRLFGVAPPAEKPGQLQCGTW